MTDGKTVLSFWIKINERVMLSVQFLPTDLEKIMPPFVKELSVPLIAIGALRTDTNLDEDLTSSDYELVYF